MWIWTGNKSAKFHWKTLSLSENIAKILGGGLLFLTHTVHSLRMVIRRPHNVIVIAVDFFDLSTRRRLHMRFNIGLAPGHAGIHHTFLPVILVFVRFTIRIQLFSFLNFTILANSVHKLQDHMLHEKNEKGGNSDAIATFIGRPTPRQSFFALTETSIRSLKSANLSVPVF